MNSKMKLLSTINTPDKEPAERYEQSGFNVCAIC